MDEVAVKIIAKNSPPVNHGTIIDRVTIVKAATTVVKAATTIDIVTYNGEGLAGDETNEVLIGEGTTLKATEIIRFTRRRYSSIKKLPNLPKEISILKNKRQLDLPRRFAQGTVGRLFTLTVNRFSI